MKAQIIAIGTELLLGDIVNTNAQFLSKELAQLGIDVYHQLVVGDNESRILEAFENAYKSCDLIITTGGLGPTEDDITKETAAKYFKKEMVLNQKELQHIHDYLDVKSDHILELNKKQAYCPVGSTILHNENGTAPGLILEEKNKIMIILPGPPREMKPIFNEQVKTFLEKKTGKIIKSKVIRLFGIGESLMADKVNHLIKNSMNPTVAPYAKESDVILRITSKAETEEECTSLIEPVYKEIKEILGEYIYAEGEKTLEEVVCEILCDKKLTVATAESCTGGKVAATLISYPGISEVFLEGAVTYSNEAKIKRLNVKKETLDKYGAVSEQTAREMAIGIAQAAGTDIGVATTGIAGPGGGTEEKPVGLVYIGIYVKGKVIVEKFIFNGNRERVRRRATLNALNLLRKEIL